METGTGKRIIVKKINDHVYLLDDHHDSTGYLVIGSKKALIIDTMNGFEDVKAVARQYTDLPLMVVNTHGHPDHIYGNLYFEEVYMHPDDYEIAMEACLDPEFQEEIKKYGAKMPPFKDILPGEVIDLGDLHLDVIGLPGHTPGSILLLLKEDRILFTGDAVNHHLWMQLPHCTSMSILRDNLKKIMYLEKEADHILHGHAQDLDDISLLRHILEAVEEILAGNTEGDEDYHWFGGVDRTHPIPNDEGVICFHPAPEWVARERKAWAEGDAKRDAGLKEPEGLIIERNISYGVFGESNLMDVYRPADAKEKLPVLINVHGGGFFYGDKELYRFYAMDMALYGFAVVNMNYRLNPDYRFPSPLSDINAVMIWIEKHASEYNMDTDRIFMMGDSAGAQLTSHYAAINSNPEFAALYPFRKHNLKLKGISLACGLYDLKSIAGEDSDDEMVKSYLGFHGDPENPQLDVCGAITDKYPAAYVFSCPNDFLYELCEPMAKLINERGGKAVSKIYGTKEMTDVGHVFHCNMKTEIGQRARKDQADFLLNL